MKNLNDILNKIRKHKDSIRKYGIERVGVFGSIARGEATDKSDIDLLVEFNPKQKTYRNFWHSSELLERLLDRQVDVVTPQALSPFIKPRVEREVKYVQIS